MFSWADLFLLSPKCTLMDSSTLRGALWTHTTFQRSLVALGGGPAGFGKALNGGRSSPGRGSQGSLEISLTYCVGGGSLGGSYSVGDECVIVGGRSGQRVVAADQWSPAATSILSAHFG